MKEKLICIDGSSLLSTSFYATVPISFSKAKTEAEKQKALEKVMKTSDGQYTNGVFKMMQLITKLIKQQNPTHLMVAWDLSRNTFRRELYPEYKAHRKETPEELKAQFALAQEVLKAMNITQYVFEKYEADDVIGTISKLFKDEIPVYIWTKDQDALQLVDDSTRLWLITSSALKMYEESGLDRKSLLVPENAFEYNPQLVKEHYGLNPIQIIDLKGICGDASDNIPGIKGVGDKTAVPLLNEFETIEDIYEFLESHDEKEAKLFMKELGITRPPYTNLMKTSENELVGKASALLSKKLATIHRDIEELQSVSLDELKLNINEDAKMQIYQQLAFKTLIA